MFSEVRETNLLDEAPPLKCQIMPANWDVRSCSSFIIKSDPIVPLNYLKDND